MKPSQRRTVPGDASINIEREHPACGEEFAAVAVLAALELVTDDTRFALPPLWPMVLDFFSIIILPPERQRPGKSFDRRWLIDQCVHVLRSPVHRHQHSGAIGMRRVLSGYFYTSPPVDEVIAAGAVPLLANLLENDGTPATQLEAVWALTNIAGGTPFQASCIVNTPGAVASLVRLIGSADPEVCDQAVWAVSNITGDFPAHRDLLIKHGIFAQLRGVITRVDTIGMPLTLRLNVTLTILNLCRGEPTPPLAAIEVAVPIVVEMVKCPDTEVARDALWTLMHISGDRNNNDGISVMIANGALPVIMHRLSRDATKILKEPALRCLGNIVAGDDVHTAAAVEHGAIRTLSTMLQTRSHNSLFDTETILWTLSNIATGNAPQINALLQTGVFDDIAQEVISNDECIRIESHKIINNALSGASLKDRIAIIDSASFRALLVAASMQRASVEGMEGIEFVLNRGADIDADELAAIVTALHGINWPVAQQHLERINGWLRRFKADPLTNVTPIQQPRRRQPRVARR
jgi:importin subunit alpha-1